jgi:hypothetical protein
MCWPAQPVTFKLPGDHHDLQLLSDPAFVHLPAALGPRTDVTLQELSTIISTSLISSVCCEIPHSFVNPYGCMLGLTTSVRFLMIHACRAQCRGNCMNAVIQKTVGDKKS